MTGSSASFLATRRGRLTLLLLCAVQFLDVADSSIMNVALPSIRRDLGFSLQNLQWVLSGLAAAAGVFLGGVLTEGPGWRWVLRTWGLAAADATQMIAFAGFVSVFFFLTLYMQNVLSYTPIRSGSAYLPVTAGIAIAAAISARMFARTGTRPVIVAGSLIAAAGIWYLSRIPVHGSYPASLLPGLVIMAIGLGAVLVSVTTAANAGVAPDQAGLAAGLLATSQQLGTALGLAIFTAIATARTSALLATHAPPAAALTGGFRRALLTCAIFLAAAAVIALRATNTRGEPAAGARSPAGHDRIPEPELTD